jgi:hypothetical protein
MATAVFTNLPFAEEDAASLASLGRIGVVFVLEPRPVDAAKQNKAENKVIDQSINHTINHSLQNFFIKYYAPE